MKVCTIENRDGKPILDGLQCSSPDEAYLLFRNKYNKALGKASYKKLGHIGQRTERITQAGIDFNEEYKEKLKEEFSDGHRIRCYIIGLIGTSYCRIFGQWGFGDQFSDYDDDRSERYLDWLLASGMDNTSLFGRRDHTGRTNLKIKHNGRRKNTETQAGGTGKH